MGREIIPLCIGWSYKRIDDDAYIKGNIPLEIYLYMVLQRYSFSFFNFI